jgi:hypothetical protein
MNEVVSKYDIPPDLVDFFDDPPLLNNESRNVYYKLRRSMIDTIAPKNTCEWILTIDLVYLTWELRGLAKRKAALVNLTWKQALCMIIETHADGNPTQRRCGAQEQTNQYFSNEKGRKDTIEFLAILGFTEDAIAAQAATLRAPELDLLDRQMERARVARMAITRDIEHHRVAGSWMQPDDLLAIADGRVASTPIEAPTERPKLAQ